LPFVIFASIFLDGLAQSFSRSYRKETPKFGHVDGRGE
jgi:hypothetical protein